MKAWLGTVEKLADESDIEGALKQVSSALGDRYDFVVDRIVNRFLVFNPIAMI